MIYLLTGLPRSGKSLYAVSTLIQKLLSDKLFNKDGSELKRRLVVDGIPKLLLPHEMMAPGVEDGEMNFTAGEGDGLWNWFDWCKPGDIICVDEVQHWWRPRGMGTKPPKMVKMLETHGHFGVDFVLITQNPMLIDQNVRRLVGRHQHVRRLFGAARALIYNWDGCNVVVSNTKGSTSSMWAYPKSAYKLYESSVLHLKQHQKIPLWLIVPVIALVAALFVMPKTFGMMAGAMSGKGVSSAPAAHVPVVASVAIPGVPQASSSAPVVAAAPLGAASVGWFAAGAGAKEVVEPVLAGCVALKNHCSCFDSHGVRVDSDPDECQAHILGESIPGQKADIAAVEAFAPVSSQPGDVDVLGFMSRHQVR